MGEMAVAMQGIYKNFGPVQALINVEFHAKKGEVHGLVGENGAGKSTLIKVLSGTILPTKGQCEVYGQPAVLRSPLQAQSFGIQTVFQELTLVPDLTVADNVLNLREGHHLLGRTSSRALTVQVEKLLSELGVDDINPAAFVRDLTLPHRQMIEIVKAIYRKPKILILDEATSALLTPQVEWLFATVRRLTKEGSTVLFTSHRWEEVKTLTENMTIFRNGEYVGTYGTDSISEDDVTTLMTGRHIGNLYPARVAARSDVRLVVRELHSDVLQNVNLTLHSGEILGIGGLQGQGQRELFLSLFGAAPARGAFEISGRAVTIHSPTDAIRQGMGIGLVPEDRKTEGLFLNLGVLDNVTVPTLSRISRWGFIQSKQQRQFFSTATRSLQIKLANVQQPVSELSGGNQQKVVLAKWLAAKSQILLLYDVTRGVDVGTKHDIYALMVDLAAQGVAILFYSSETAEVVHLAHRVLVMYEGAICEEIDANDLTVSRVVGASFRSSPEVLHG